MIWLTAAQHLGDHRVRLTFSDGAEGVVDLHATIFADPRPIFRSLRDVAEFRRFRVEMDTLVWTNGLDLAPEYLYRLAIGESRSAA